MAPWGSLISTLQGISLANGIIYQVDSAGQLTKMHPGKPASEDQIQVLIAQHPEMVTGIDEPLLLIRREQPIADKVDGGGRWSLDHLFVTRDGKPVLVEVKQASNTQLRREVVGQILEYAANAVLHWGRGKLADAFTARFESEDDAAQALEDFLRSGGDAVDELEISDPSSFWERAEANLQAGALKLVIVADQIPRELARIIEFLNEQMRADVQAVELRWFTSENGLTALVPRVIGATERAAERKMDSVSKPVSDYWTKLKGLRPELIPGKPWKGDAQDFFSLRTGDPKIVVGARFVKGDLRLHAYFDRPRAKEAYAVVRDKAHEVEDRYGKSLSWDEIPGYQAARILDVLANADPEDSADWPRQHEWLTQQAVRLREAVIPVLPYVEAAIDARSA